MTQELNDLPRWGQYASGGVLLAVALTAGGTSLVLNVSHGLGAGLASGVAFGLADVAKISIPIVAGLIGWNRQMRVTAVVCVFVSLWAASNYFADEHGARLLDKQHAATVYTGKAERIATLEDRATALQAMAKTEAGRGGCGDRCQALQANADNAFAALATARDELTTAKPVEISGLAVMAATVTGAEPSRVARLNGAVTAVLFLALLEALVWLSVPAMRTLRKAKPHVHSQPEPEQAEPEAVAGKASDLPESLPANQPRDAKGRFARKDWTRPESYGAGMKETAPA